MALPLANPLHWQEESPHTLEISLCLWQNNLQIYSIAPSWEKKRKKTSHSSWQNNPPIRFALHAGNISLPFVETNLPTCSPSTTLSYILCFFCFPFRTHCFPCLFQFFNPLSLLTFIYLSDFPYIITSSWHLCPLLPFLPVLQTVPFLLHHFQFVGLTHKPSHHAKFPTEEHVGHICWLMSH